MFSNTPDQYIPARHLLAGKTFPDGWSTGSKRDARCRDSRTGQAQDRTGSIQWQPSQNWQVLLL
jgi:hypothetical protein